MLFFYSITADILKQVLLKPGNNTVTSISKLCGIALLAFTLPSCGGGGGGGTSNQAPPAVSNSSVGGIWQGKDPITGSDILGVVAEDGRAQFIVFDAEPFTQYWGSLTTSGTNVSGNNFQVADGNVYYGTASITGSVTQRSTLTVTVSFTPVAGCPVTTCGSARTATGSLTYSNIYNQGGALSRIAGNWRDISTRQIYNINSNGVVFQQDAQTGCVINGQASTINATYNAYAANYNFSNCRAPFTALNGTQATGLLFVTDAVSPPRIYLAAQYRAQGTTYTVYGVGIKE